MVQHELALPANRACPDNDRMPTPMLICLNLTDAHQRLSDGTLDCSRHDCAGTLGPWGSARPRTIRTSSQTTVQYTPRRGRCRACRRTHVLASSRTHPRRLDTAANVGSALLAASSGQGHRPIAARLGLPATTVRGWLRRARANVDAAMTAACQRAHLLDPSYDSPSAMFRDPFVDMLEVIGHAIQVFDRRFGPLPEPWDLSVNVTRGCLLAPPVRQRRIDSG